MIDLPAPRVSVLTPTYNVARYVGDALRSALAQRLDDFEIIVIDDGSTDNTVAVIRSFQDPRIRLFERPHEGPVSALNAALAAARGEIVAFLDGDDVWHPEKLVRHIRFLEEHPEIDATFSWYVLIDENGHEFGVVAGKWRGSLTFEQLLLDNVVGNGSSVVARRSALLAAKGFDGGLRACYDLDMWLRIALLRTGNIACVPAVLVYYRQRRDQMTKNLRLMQDSWNQLMEKMRSIAPRQTAFLAARAQSNMSRYFAFILHENGDYQGAGAYLFRSFRQAPCQFVSDRRSWRMLAANAAGLILPARYYQILRGLVLRLLNGSERAEPPKPNQRDRP